jgi:hypothetical protein
MRLVAFCEAVADFRMASDLVDRVLREHAPDWVGDVLDAEPVGIRAWKDDGQGREFFLVRALVDYASRLQIRVPQGHFDSRRGAADALMGRTAFSIRAGAGAARGCDRRGAADSRHGRPT